jgi:hypothetical protein
MRTILCLGGLDGGQNHGLIGANAGALFQRMRVAPLQQDILLGAHHEEGGRQGEYVDLTKIIGELRHEKERLDRVIASVGELQEDGDVPQKNVAAGNSCRPKSVGRSRRG